MASPKKISALTALTTALNSDLLVIVDVATGITKKITVANFIKSGGGVVKVTKGFADFQPEPGATKSLVLTTIPAGGLITGVKMKHSAAFGDGGVGVGSATVEVLDDNATQYGGTFDVFQAPGNTVGEAFTGMNGSLGVIPNHSVASNLNVLLTLGGPGPSIDNLIAGSVDFFIEIKIFKS